MPSVERWSRRCLLPTLLLRQLARAASSSEDATCANVFSLRPGPADPSAAGEKTLLLVRHARLSAPLEIVLDGRSCHGVVMKPGKPFDTYVSQVDALMLALGLPRQPALHTHRPDSSGWQRPCPPQWSGHNCSSQRRPPHLRRGGGRVGG